MLTWFRKLSRLLSQPGFFRCGFSESVRDPDNPATHATSVQTGSFASFLWWCGAYTFVRTKCVGLEGRELGGLFLSSRRPDCSWTMILL
jgi:hypothetical protein